MENKRIKSKGITGAYLTACFIVIVFATICYFCDANQQELKRLKAEDQILIETIKKLEQLKEDKHYQNDVKG